ncbi:TRAP transporter small permease [Pseudomonas sp. S 311-6]|nr:TRAP transporter small permease [Pseudomonas sp. S 311-6]
MKTPDIDCGTTGARPVREPLSCRVSAAVVAQMARISLALAALCVLVAMGLIAYSVVFRYILGTPSLWVDEVVGYLVLGTVMFGAAAALRDGSHIGVDLLTSSLNGRARRWARSWSHLVVLAVSLFLVVNGWQTAMFSRDIGIVSNGYVAVPMYWLQLMMPLGGLMLLVVAINALLRLACGLDDGQTNKGAH